MTDWFFDPVHVTFPPINVHPPSGGGAYIYGGWELAGIGSAAFFAQSFVSPHFADGVDLLSLTSGLQDIDWSEATSQSTALNTHKNEFQFSSVEDAFQQLMHGVTDVAQKASRAIVGLIVEHVYVTGTYVGPDGRGWHFSATASGNLSSGASFGSPGASVSAQYSNNPDAMITGGSWSFATPNGLVISGTTTAAAFGVNAGSPGVTFSVAPPVPVTIPGP